jgi:vacuolar protein sorting-associated protein 13A/C
VILLDVVTRIATLVLSTTNVPHVLENSAMKVEVQLGNLSLMDDSSQPTRFDAYEELVRIEGRNLLDLTYETFNAHMRSAAGGVDSAVTLRSGSIKIRFAERPLHDLHPFMIQFARLKCLYDSATHAAAASEIQKMKLLSQYSHLSSCSWISQGSPTNSSSCGWERYMLGTNTWIWRPK